MTTRVRLDDQLCFSLYAATNSIVRAYRPRLRELGLTYPQLLALIVLWQDGPSTIGHIALRLELPSHAITPLIDRLASGRFVERVRGTDDRRVTTVHLTETGAALESAVGEVMDSVACQTGLTDEGIVELRVQLRTLGAQLQAAERVLDAVQPKKTSASA